MGPGLIWIKKNWKIVQKQSFASVQFVPICPLWCSNIKSKIGVGRHAVSRYHQLKKFFIAGDDPDYCDHIAVNMDREKCGTFSPCGWLSPDIYHINILRNSNEVDVH